MKVCPEIEVSNAQHEAIQALRNKTFPDHQVSRSYYKQLLHMRALQYQGNQLIGCMGLDYRAVNVGGELHDFYVANGFQLVESYASWLRIHEHTNYGVAVEYVDELYVKPMKDKSWPAGHMDWLGYMY